MTESNDSEIFINILINFTTLWTVAVILLALLASAGYVYKPTHVISYSLDTGKFWQADFLNHCNV